MLISNRLYLRHVGDTPLQRGASTCGHLECHPVGLCVSEMIEPTLNGHFLFGSSSARLFHQHVLRRLHIQACDDLDGPLAGLWWVRQNDNLAGI